jgi:hypothetical protein
VKFIDGVCCCVVCVCVCVFGGGGAEGQVQAAGTGAQQQQAKVKHSDHDDGVCCCMVCVGGGEGGCRASASCWNRSSAAADKDTCACLCTLLLCVGLCVSWGGGALVKHR